MRHDPSLAPIYSLPSNLDDGQREAYTWVRSQLTGFQPELLEPLASAIIEMGHASTAFDVAERRQSEQARAALSTLTGAFAAT